MLEEPEKVTQIIVKAVELTGERVVLQSSWSDMGAVDCANILPIGRCPHDWLFEQCGAVIHHGGAGTVAAGLKAGCPTLVIPFCGAFRALCISLPLSLPPPPPPRAYTFNFSMRPGDQHFWGEMVHRAGCGPPAIPIGSLSVSKLCDAIKFLRTAEVLNRAQAVKIKIIEEDGVQNGVNGTFFYGACALTSSQICSPAT